jgi:GNAT superfamily N-acetyltransferase
MPDVPVRLRPIEETDLELLSRFDTDPAASQPFGWTGVVKAGGPEGGCLEIGALLFPEHRGRGFGTAAQRLLVDYLFGTTLANRLQAITDVENLASSGCWSGSGPPRGRDAWPGLHRWAVARRSAVRPATGRPA